MLFAIRNGGFSGAIMPANIVVGEDAEDGRRLPRQVLRRPGPEEDLTDTGSNPGG